MCLYVREISMAEGRQIQHILRHSRNRIKVRRAQVVLGIELVAYRLNFCGQLR